jgi:hypothetical protein
MILTYKKIFYKLQEDTPTGASINPAPKTKEDVASLKNEIQNFPKDQRIQADNLENFKAQYISNHSIDVSKLSQAQKNALDKNLQELFDAHKKVVDLRIQSKIPWSEGRYIVYKIDQMPEVWKDASDRDTEHDLLKHAERMKLEADTLTEEADRLQAEINLKTKEGPKATTQEQREIHLNKSYESTQKNLPKELQESFWKKNYDSLTAWDILTMKKNGVDLSQFLLVKASWEPKEVSKASMGVGDKFIVNFWRNTSIDRWIGAGDIFPIDQISKVSINGIEWTRKSNPRPWFYRKDGKYLAIHDGDIVDIVEKKPFSNDEEKKTFWDAELSWFKNLRKKDLAEAMNNMWEVTESQNPFSLPSDKALFEEMLTTDYKWKVEISDGRIKTIGGKKFKEIFNQDQKIDFSGVRLDGNTKQIAKEVWFLLYVNKNQIFEFEQLVLNHMYILVILLVVVQKKHVWWQQALELFK